MTFTHAVSTDNYGPAKWIVDASAANGTHTTIQAAITSASSGDTVVIRPGTYTENLTLKAGVNLCAFGSDSSANGTGHVIISGTCTLTTAGTVSIFGIQLQTNSAALLAVTGTLASVVNLFNCYLNCTNNSGITHSSSSPSSTINIYNCEGDLGTTGIALFVSTSAGGMFIRGMKLTNTGSSTTASSVSTAGVVIDLCDFAHALTTTSTGTINIRWCIIGLTLQNTTALTTAGTGTSGIFASNMGSGTASVLSIGAGTTVQATNATLTSSNTNVMTGAGILNYSFITFGGSSSGHNVSTETAYATLI